MAKIIILGAGISGHTASTLLRKMLGKEHEITVVSPNSQWNWIPSNIWVGVGIMNASDVTFPLDPVYKKMGIHFEQAKVLEIHPEGDAEDESPFIVAEYTHPENKGEQIHLEYDYLINATGPKLNFDATPGLGPQANSLSVCTYGHAEQTARALEECIQKMKNGQKQTLVIGMGHGGCTCEGAAFEYVFNVEYELRRRGVRDKARIVFITNEYELGDFGIGGMHLKRGGYVVHSKTFAESLFSERGIHWIKRAHVMGVRPHAVDYVTLENKEGSISFDFAMLLPPFSGVGIQAFDKKGKDITSEIFAPNGFMKVDADYTPKSYEQWKASDWPQTYQNQKYKNLFAVGIAFAPPHPISKPMKTSHGYNITPAPPRTGMPSGMMAKTVAKSIAEMIRTGSSEPRYKASMADMGAACVASAGASMLGGTAATMTMYPIVPDFDRFPEFGRDVSYTFGEIGLAAHWIKRILHHMFLYKAQCKPGWSMIPE